MNVAAHAISTDLGGNLVAGAADCAASERGDLCVARRKADQTTAAAGYGGDCQTPGSGALRLDHLRRR
jgi:hypothetical protein